MIKHSLGWRGLLLIGWAVGLGAGIGGAVSAHANIFTADETGTTVASFLKHPVGPRGVAMGQAFTPIAEGPEALWWNPAGLLGNESEVLLESNIYAQELLVNTLAYQQPLNEGNTLGIMVNYVSLNTPMKGYDNAQNFIGELSYADMAFTVMIYYF